MLPPERPRLARHSGGEKVRAFPEVPKIESSDISLMKRPVNQRLYVPSLVLSNSFTRIGIDLDNGPVLEPGIRYPKRKSPHTSKQFNRCHHRSNPETPVSYASVSLDLATGTPR